MSLAVDCFLWPLIFQHLGPEDLIRISSVCFSWWQLVFGSRGLWKRNFRRCTELDLANTATLYHKVPLRIFRRLRSLDLTGTAMSTKDLLKITETAHRLQMLKIESCSQIAESAIFKAKDTLRHLTHFDISNNSQFTILSIACLCSYHSLQEICAHGLRLEQMEILFLTKTFPRLVNGELELATENTDGDYFFNAVEIVADGDIFDDFF